MRPRFVFASILAVTSLVTTTGCGNRYFSPRTTNPLIEDRVRLGASDANKMSVLTSRADRRTILLFGAKEVCAEPSPDVAEAIFSQKSAEIASETANAALVSTLQTALMQLTRRSQGLDYFRTGSFVYCMMSYNGKMSPSEYQEAMRVLLDKSQEMTLDELKHLPEIAKTLAQVTNPSIKIAETEEMKETSAQTPAPSTADPKP